MVTVNQQCVLITGAAKRIGRVIALAMAKRGWHVAVHYGHSKQDAMQTVQDICALGARATAVCADLANADDVKTLLARAAAGLGVATSQMRCVVNNASLFLCDSAEDFSIEALDKHMHTNLAAPILLAQALHEATPTGAQSVVINILDQKLFNLNPDFLSYTLSKAALHTANDLLARAFAPKLRVVGVAPGLSLPSGSQSVEDFNIAHQCTPLGASSTPDDVAATVCFIAENSAITGTTIVVDGGQHLVPLQRDVMFVAGASSV